jgi:hypothetical protein
LRARHPHCAVYDLHSLQHFLYACLPWVNILHILREQVRNLDAPGAHMAAAFLTLIEGPIWQLC